ncbi:hypothetical protein J4219_07775 [Candidatus Woesearchaeota archaeon]|nr:hypothetical protein [Candidatus Woesearchaeota archaeon]
MKHLFTMLVLAVFALGVGVGGLFSMALPSSQIDIESNTVTSRGLSFNTVTSALADATSPLQSKAQEQSFEMPVERISPGDWIKESSIEMRPDGVLIKFDNPQWAILADTNSMDPVFDEASHLIQKIPLSAAEIQAGDIVSYDSPMGFPIVHRVVEIGNDSEGWYAILKGDNNPQPDPWKVRFDMVRRVTVIVVY